MGNNSGHGERKLHGLNKASEEKGKYGGSGFGIISLLNRKIEANTSPY